MNLEQQVCSLELAKRLKELGVKQVSLFYYCERLTGYHNETEIKIYINTSTTIDEITKYSAFTVAELGEMLPIGIDTKKDEPFNHYRFTMHKALIVPELSHLITETIYCVNYECDTVSQYDEWFRRKLTNNIYDSNEANSRAKMLIVLIENEYVKVEDLNNES